MHVKVYLADGGTLDVSHFDAGTALDLKEGLEGDDAPEFMTFEMDAATVLIARRHVVRIDLEGGF